MRAKKKDTLTKRGFQIYYNFGKPHQALDGETPAQKAGIEIGLDKNKWLNLITKAHNNKIGENL